MNGVVVRRRTPDDDDAIVGLYANLHIDRPPMTVAELRHRNVDSQPPSAHAELWVAELGGRIVGYTGWNRLVYVENQHSWWCFTIVDKSLWGRGIGTALYRVVETSVRGHGAVRLSCDVRGDLPHALAFAEHRGFVPNGRVSRLSWLDPRRANLERSREAYERALGSGIRFATVAELGIHDAVLLPALHVLDGLTEASIPNNEESEMMPYEEWYADVFQSPGSTPETFWVAVDGDRPVAMALLTRRANNWLDNHYTATDPKYRGRGLARALKYLTVQWARDQNAAGIITGNDLENKPMLAINDDLGYQPLPPNIEMTKAFAAAP